MKKTVLLLMYLSLVIFSSCKKDDDVTPPVTEPVTSSQVLAGFANSLANPNYQDLQAKANILNNAILALNASTTQTNLDVAQAAWLDVRNPWEQSEAFLFGPAEDFNYDPATDTWPVNTTELDSLLASTNPLLLANIDSLQYSLKGYHAIEYMLFGVGNTRIPTDFDTRELQYTVSLSQSLYNVTTELRNSWDPNIPGNFTEQLITAGNGSFRYASRKDALLAIVGAVSGICDEVANNKMEAPLAALDSLLVESQYAQIATLDFKNNMIGVQNVYLSRYTTTGKSLHDLVSAKDASLDNQINADITSAINALNAINPNYGEAIFTQQGEIQIAQNAINNLKGTLNLLNNFVLTNVTD